MLQSISKYRLYLYLFFFIFLSSVFNFQFLKKYQEMFSLKTITINGLSNYEKKIVQKELNNLKYKNILKLRKDSFVEKLSKFHFLESLYVTKIIPSSINIKVSKTPIIGKTIINGEKFYIGKNGNFINSEQITEETNVASVFGDFKADDFINLKKILNQYGSRFNSVSNYYYYKNKRWDLLFSDGQILMLPSKKYEKSIKIYKKLLDNKNLINTKIIDLRVTNQIILTSKDE